MCVLGAKCGLSVPAVEDCRLGSGNLDGVHITQL